MPKVFVEVYNNSGITGLAAETARVLERAGWNVAATDNWYGNIPANTVYYPARLDSQAEQLGQGPAHHTDPAGRVPHAVRPPHGHPH